MRIRYQRGISIPAILGILAVITVLALGFMGMVRFQVQRTGFEQATINAAYIAEIGFQQVRAELAAKNGEWSDLVIQSKPIVKACATTDPFYQRCQRIPATNTPSNFIKVYEDPTTQSKVIGVYEVAVETGQKRSIFGNRTLTGATQGFVPGSALPAEQIGYDIHGNRLCNQADPAIPCPGGFVGVKVVAWLTDSQGNILPKSRSQSVYGVLQLDSRDPDDDGPSGYLLESNAKINILSSTDWEPSTFRMMPMGGFYGPMHTNEHYEFEWESYVHREINRNSPANTADDLANPNPAVPDAHRRPFWGVLMNDIGVQSVPTPRLYTPGTDITYLPFGKVWSINWAPVGPEPAPGSVYEVVFQPYGLPSASVNVVHGPANGIDYVVSPLNIPFVNGTLAQIRQGATVYPLPAAAIPWAKALMDWRVLDPNTLAFSNNGTGEPGTGDDYRVRYLAHSPITVFEQMTYSNGAPIYRYWHEHAMNTGWPYYQAGHGHGNVMGASLTTNSTAVGADPGYHAATWRHSHYISNDVSVDPIPATPSAVPNTYLKFMSPGFKPQVAARHEPPLLRPESGVTNFTNQMEQLNKYLQLTLGITMPRNPDGTLDSSSLAGAPFNATNYSQGYILGKFPSTFPVTTPPTVDFRAVYFGTDIRYTAGASSGSLVLPTGSSIDTTAWIWVDDNAASPNYMKIANSRLDSNYRRYLYRQIPPGKVILVRDAMVLIGNLIPQGNPPDTTCQAMGAHCLDYHQGFVTDPPGQATIIDGQLSIISFTDSPPAPGQSHNYNKGDIVIVGNVLYHNDFYTLPTDKTQMRQLEPQPTSPYTRSNNVNAPITDINDASVMWTTKDDGTRFRNSSGVPVGLVNGLGLFATHDVKISVTPLGNGYNADSSPFCNGTGTRDNFVDRITIHGQLVAGNRVRVNAFLAGVPQLNLQEIDLAAFPCSSEPAFESEQDSLRIYGTVYSRESPDFSSYFRIRREYYFDRALEKNPLMGAPYYPTAAGDYRNQTVYSEFPKLVQGSWVQGSN